jgi:hypothetical protein
MAGTINGPNPQGAVNARIPEPPKTGANLPVFDREHNFVFWVDPGRWDVFTWADGTEELLPVLLKQKLDPGVGGITETGATGLSDAAWTNKGRIKIPRTYDENDYVRVIDVRNGPHYHEKWRAYQRQGQKLIENEFAFDKDGYLAFLRDIVEKHNLLPSPAVLDGRQNVFRAKLVRQIEAAQGNPLKAINAERTQDKIDTLEAFKQGAKTIPPKKPKAPKAVKGKDGPDAQA